MNIREPLIPELNSFKVDITTERWKDTDSPDIDQIHRLDQAGCITLCSEIHKLINFVCNKKELARQ
jgi:hypothetical protein